MGTTTLATTTLPFPTRCARCQRFYAALRAKVARWHRSVFPSAIKASETGELLVSEDIRDLALDLPPLPHTTQCRTKCPNRISDLTEGLKIKVDALETHGGMGRIYSLRDSAVILKISDIATSWSRYEPGNYKLLENAGIPCAQLMASARRTLGDTCYVIMVLERLEFTMTAFIRAIGRTRDADPKFVAGLLRGILHLMETQEFVYGDLSPDNIMFRPLGDCKYELSLIDPQFLVPTKDFKKAMGEQRGSIFDTTYLALKVQAIGMLDPAVSKFTDAVCAGVLGHTPPEKHTRHWLLHEAPVGLFMAYDILRANSLKAKQARHQSQP